jgi:hypothetical protein
MIKTESCCLAVLSIFCKPFTHLSFLDVSSDLVEGVTSDFLFVDPYAPFVAGDDLLWW